MPFGRLPTFHVRLKDQASRASEFRLGAHRIFSGIDVYNDGPNEAALTFRSAENGAFSSTIPPGELRRLRTGWRAEDSKVTLALENGEGLRFDNLAYR